MSRLKWIIPALLFIGAFFWHLHTVPTTPIEEAIEEKVDEIFFGGTLSNNVAVDTTVEITNSATNISSPGIVWTSDTTGYVFYEDSGGGLSMSSTTDSGATWSAGRNVDSVNTADVVSFGVWWEGWTPGTTTTRYIHIVTTDLGVDDTYYTRLDLNTGTFSASVLGTTQGATCADGTDCYASITMTATGTLMMMGHDAGDTWTVRCGQYLGCSTAANWHEVTGHGLQLFNGWGVLLPIPGTDNILLVHEDTANQDGMWNVYSATSSTWWPPHITTDTIWTNDAFNTTYDAQALGATLSTSTGLLYVARASLANDYTTADHAVAFYTFSTTTWTWTTQTRCVLGGAPGIIGAKVAWDETNDTLYCIFGLRTTIGTNTTGGIYYKTSNDNGATWSATSTMVNDNADDINGLTTNIIGHHRIGVTWNYTTAPRDDDQYYDDIADLIADGGGGGGGGGGGQFNVIWLD